MDRPVNDQCRCYLFNDTEVYGELSEGIVVRGRARPAISRDELIEIPDFDDRPWEGPYDGDE